MKSNLVIEGALKKNYDPIIKDSKAFKAKRWFLSCNYGRSR